MKKKVMENWEKEYKDKIASYGKCFNWKFKGNVGNDLKGLICRCLIKNCIVDYNLGCKQHITN